MPQSSGLDQSAVSPHVLNQQLNQEIEDLYLEVEELHRETALLTGLMAGSYAYFLQKLMLGHQGQAGLSAEECEQIVVETVLQKMSQPLPLEPYLQQMNQ
jgi:hypothetical protein